MNIRPGRILALALPLVLGACSTLPSNTATSTSATDTSARTYHSSIEMGGRLSVRYQRDGNEEALHGSFAWDQTPDRTIVTLLSPLGQTLAVIDITPREAVLMQPGQPPRSAQDVDTLTAATLGWPLPVSGLQHWLQGFIVDTTSRKLHTIPTETALINTSDGWRLQYVSWQQDSQAYPRRIDLERHTAQAGDVSLRIVVDRRQVRD